MSEFINNGSTPLMKQFFEIKNQYPEALLMFQVGDFYELFFDDAKVAAAFLGITLTARGKNQGEEIPLCGVPVHALDYYVAKLVKGGFRIAICDQLEEARPGKVVKRGVTRVLTPGTLTDAQLLETKSASYLLSCMPLDDEWGLLFGELLTAQLFATVISAEHYHILESELSRFFPDEVILPQQSKIKPVASHIAKLGYCTTLHGASEIEKEEANKWMSQQFRVEQIKSVHEHPAMVEAFSLFYSYLKRNQEQAVEQFKQLHVYKPDDFLQLDRSTTRHLELVKNNQEGTTKNTLFEVMDGAVTGMGSRMIKKWIVRPLVKKDPIVHRQEVVEQLVSDSSTRNSLRECFMEIGDIERVVGRIALARGVLNDYLSLQHALYVLPKVQHLLSKFEPLTLVRVLTSSIGNYDSIAQLLSSALNDDPSKDWIIKREFDQQLDYIRDLVEQSNEKILELERIEQNKTGINSLKIRYNQVHGYYIEVTKTNLAAVPEYYIRHQTLVGKERFTTTALKELENEIVQARAQIESIENQVFARVKNEVAHYVTALRKTAQSLAHLDALVGFALIAYENNFTKPHFHDSRDIIINQGRHPVVARVTEHRFIANDTMLSHDQRLWIITGPNMGGKSTFLRQVALLCIMAQCGSFIPAKSAQLPLLDRIFTRIGASDNVAQGKSTFLVEMEETALICTYATEKSLVILDEVGRGTSTFDGLAIAQSVVEYLYTVIGARCLFATHYHELTNLASEFPGIVNYHAANKRVGERMLLLYKMVPGIADGSFGVEVARLAQLPESIIKRSAEIIEELKNGTTQDDVFRLDARAQQLTTANKTLNARIAELQKKSFIAEKINEIIDTIDFNQLSPKQAFDLLWHFKERHTQMLDNREQEVV
ncbi:MAG: DNA mismatch repair protein MutS [Candidatus Dependentiae bacterium ADurb.Bin331]|nr:MAG: DNA mismatch repair protein MutS [Candidatus Dependentiae bacterium ADurb.Bin331]